MTKYRDMNPKQKRNLFITLGVVGVVILSLLISLIVYVAPVSGEKTTEHWFYNMPYTKDYAINIYTEPNKDFKVLAIADTQLADLVEVGGQGDPIDEMKLLADIEKPDLIIVMGDITWTAFTKHSVKKFVKCMDEIGIPWAPIIGNHEDEREQGYSCHVDRNWVADRMMESETCLFKKGPNNIGGVGNYVINIIEKDKETGNENIRETLVMMDSHAKRQYPEYDNGWYYDYIYDAQMLWYKWVIEGVTAQNGGRRPESMVYLHIPLPEYEIAYTEYAKARKAYEDAEKIGDTATMGVQKAIIDSFAYTGKNMEGVWGSNTAGDNKLDNKEEQLENCVNSGFFEYLKDNGTKYVYAGHDHRNNYSILWEGIRLTYTTKTGYKCSYEPDRTGGTTITIGSDRVVMKHIYAVYKDGKLTGLKQGEVF